MKRHDIIKAAKIANILLCAMLAGSCSALADELPDSYFETDNVASAVTTASGSETTSVSVSQTQENIVSLETTAEIYKNTVTAAECTFETAVSRANVPETTIPETTVPETISEITAFETAVITSEETAFKPLRRLHRRLPGPKQPQEQLLPRIPLPLPKAQAHIIPGTAIMP